MACQEAKPLHFHTTCLRRLLNFKRQDKVPDTKALACAELPSIHTILLQHQLRWADHLVRMSDDRIPKRLLYSELEQGNRSHGGRRKRFKDTLKASLKAFSIAPGHWEEAAQD